MRQLLLSSRPLIQSLRSTGHDASPGSVLAFATASRCSLTSTRPHQRSYVHHARLRPLVRCKMPGLKRNACGCACASGGGCGSSGPQKKTAYIALGSNMGDRVAEIERACNEMDRRGIKVKRTSSLWETEPMYVTDQDRFVNGACEVCISKTSVRVPALTNPLGRDRT